MSATTTTLVPFTPDNSATPPFSANVVLDGQSYSLQARWNLYAQRWYVYLVQGGVVVQMQPLIGSPGTDQIELFFGVFTTSTIIFNESSGNFEITS